ncbi:tripartite tricarboxylate transporter TctB family protein [Metabacillus herbersteinensis]|uniref:Tripartite tricarboxylate transporter TctB family protein n=1 Tax=Metabacillus herbersteinensis TaxID=283816 RepID=A0ABV6G9V7_9BACI
MRAVFSGILLVLSIFFTIYGFNYDYLTNGGQVGAGFFPRWIGFLLILFTGISFWKDLRIVLKEKQETKELTYVKTVVYVLGLSVLFIASLQILGTLLSMIFYVFSLLILLNSGKIWTNVIVSLAVPIGTYLLLETWLNAGFPKGFLGF